MKDALNSYDYNYPEDLVALNPLSQKDQANMLVYKDNSFLHRKVFDLLEYISKNDLLVFNNTRVLPCRVTGIIKRTPVINKKTKISVTLNKVIEGNICTTFCTPLK